MADFDEFEPVIPTAGDGVVISGPALGAAVGDHVAFLGDVSGDGIGDFAVTSAATGDVYVIYGKLGGPVTDLSTFGADDGLLFSTGASGSVAVTGVGDVDGDGVGDFAIRSPTGSDFYIVYGGSDGQRSNVFPGVPGPGLAISISGAGDINGDGLDDIIVGQVNPAGQGGATLLFGQQGGISALSPIFVFGAETGALTGYAVSSAGDVNGDGFDDLLIGAPKAAGSATTQGGSAYVVFGHGGAWSDIDLAYLDGTNGFRIDGNYDHSWLGASTAHGDLNGDGLSDLFIGSPGLDDTANPQGGRSGTYVIFGHRGPFNASYNMLDRNGADAFRLWGSALGDQAGQKIAVGDINGDGLDDLATFMVGGNSYDWGFVLLGKQTAFPFGPVPSTSNNRGFFLDGWYQSTWEFQGVNPSVALGDINGDGAADLITGLVGLNGGAGGAAILYGQATDVTRTGTAGADYLISGAGADLLLGMAGKDTLVGGYGADLMDGGTDNDVLYAGAGADTVIGGLGADSLYGEDGDDILNGGDGADKLNGGTGADSLIGGAGADRMDGGAGNDVLNGGADNDYLDGGAGADSMTGGAGNDVFLFDDIGDAAVELSGGGYDIVRAFAEAVLSSNVEALQLQGAADIDGTGNAEANHLQGNSGDNLLKGLAGVDTITGNDGDDIIVGGLGNDLLRGGAGADSFAVLQESVGATVLETDQILDFSTLEGDRLDLSAIDANSRSNGDQAFRLVSAFSKYDAAHPELTGQMTLSFSGGVTLIRLDLNGDGKADYQMKINGDVTHDSAGWLL